jgi:hypothetical protein
MQVFLRDAKGFRREAEESRRLVEVLLRDAEGFRREAEENRRVMEILLRDAEGFRRVAYAVSVEQNAAPQPRDNSKKVMIHIAAGFN